MTNLAFPHMTFTRLDLPYAKQILNSRLQNYLIERGEIDAGIILMDQAGKLTIPSHGGFETPIDQILVSAIKVFQRTKKTASTPSVNGQPSLNGQGKPIHWLLEKEGFQTGTIIFLRDQSLGAGCWITFSKPAEQSSPSLLEWLLKVNQPGNQISLMETTNHLLDILFHKDPNLKPHVEESTKIAVSLAKAIGLDQKEIDQIAIGAQLHDLGKLIIPQEVLDKPTKLSEQEWFLVKKHPAAASAILSSMQMSETITNIAHYHHERWDGSGYPGGLASNDIPLEARIFAIADVFNALCFDRPYSKAVAPDEAKAFICNNSGVLFDPELVAVFLDRI